MPNGLWLGCLAALALVVPVTSAFADALTDRGAYLAAIMDCGGCHTPGALAGDPDPERYLGGSDIGFMMPGLGIFYPPNLTPDATGLGAWTAEEIIRAVREGVRPDGSPIAPIMPWPSYAALTDEDAMALVAYLQSLPPVDHEVPAIVGPDGTAVAPYLAPVIP
jgi:mono/diheme cytochrome c family protein